MFSRIYFYQLFTGCLLKSGRLLLLLIIPLLSLAQHRGADSMKMQLLFLKDSSRVNCLNKISLAYYVNALNENYTNVQTDSAISYAMAATREAVKINYTRGLAAGLQNLGEIGRDRGDFISGENYLRQSVSLFGKLQDQERMSWANTTLGWCLHKQGKFLEANEVYERAMVYALSADNKLRQSMLFRLISYTYKERGYNEKALENMLLGMRITNKISDARGIISSPQNMANLYKNAGDIDMALKYFRIAAQNAKAGNPVRYYDIMGDIARVLNRLDSAIYYYHESDRYVRLATSDIRVNEWHSLFALQNIADIYFTQHKYDLVIEKSKYALQFYKPGNDINGIMVALNFLASSYQAKQDFTGSFFYGKQLFKVASESGARPFLRDAYQLYWKNYERLGNTDSAYKYSLKYTALKDSILTDEYRKNLAVAEMKSQDEQQKIKISLLQKDQQISQERLSLQQQKLKSESFMRYILIAAGLALLLIGIFIFRNDNLKRKNEKQHLEYALELQQLESKKNIIEFQQQATDLEMQALRAQMNPHFIFNCLSSINRYILINKTEEASDYLTKFSRLIRMALHNSEKTYISLENELEGLRLYLDLERLRFKNAFSYSITSINDIDSNAVFIPPMLIQPFAENAIWHGLMHKKGAGCLEIRLCTENKIFTCVIIDNGIGRNKASAVESRSAKKDKSMGVQITAGRLALLNRSNKETAVFNIEDLVDEEGNGAGTKVILTMPYRDLTEVAV